MLRLAGVALALIAVAVTAPAAGAARRICPRTAYPISSALMPRSRLVHRNPTGVLLCAYGGFNQPHPRRLTRSRAAGAPRARQLARQLNALPPLPPGAVACPVDLGAEVVAFFHHRRGRDDTVVIHTQGCREVRSGARIRTAMLPPGPHLLRELFRLLR